MSWAWASLIALASVAGCKRTDDAAPTPEASASAFGMMRFNTDPSGVLPPVTEGWTGCTPDFFPGTTLEQGAEARLSYRKHPITPSLLPLRATASYAAPTLTIRAIGEAPLRLNLASWAKHVAVGSAVEDQLDSTGEWDSFYGQLLNAVLPTKGFVAYAGEESWRASGVFTDLAARFYVIDRAPKATAELIATDGTKVLKVVGCSQEELQYLHRNEWRKETSSTSSAHRVRLSASLFYYDYGGVATVDVQVSPLGKGSLVIACMYSGARAKRHCDELIAEAAPVIP